MSAPEVVTATPREGKFTKNVARRVRVAGSIPAVVYGAQQPSVAVTVDPKQIRRILHSESGHNTIFDLDVSGSVAKVMVVDWQNDPIKGNLIHIDMKRIAMDKMMRVEVPIQLLGVPVGVKTQGGILDQVLREIEIECLPSDIPGHIDIDVSELAFGMVIRVADLPHNEKLKFITDEKPPSHTSQRFVRKSWPRRMHWQPKHLQNLKSPRRASRMQLRVPKKLKRMTRKTPRNSFGSTWNLLAA